MYSNRCVVFTCLCLVSVTTGSLDHILHHYDTLHHRDIAHNVVRRSSSSAGEFHVRHISFSTLGRDFKLKLTKRNGLVSEDFRASSIQNGVKTAEQVDTDIIYTGHLEDQSNSRVKAIVEADRLTATIRTPEDTYIVEPSWRHIKEPHNFTMIAYRTSDLKANSTGGSFCGHGHLVPKELEKIIGKTNSRMSREVKGHHRSRRATSPSKNTCPLLLVADFHFYQEIGQRDSAQTINYLLGLVDRVDEIYTKTQWDSGYTGFGFEIKEIIVHKEPTDPESPEHRYNIDQKWDVNELLVEFGLNKENAEFCLVHLFTHQDFDGGILGLAWIGNENLNAVGGICTKTYRSQVGNQYLNTGLTSTINWGRTIVTQQADLVTAHEFGHNFGSEHDSDSGEDCTPEEDKGGKYIMYPSAVNGNSPNNNEFSPCSLKHVAPVLKAKSSSCFEERVGAFCGNSKVEDNEECDAGFDGLGDNDPCCSTTCQLKPNARCSDVNSLCCSGCIFKTYDQLCRGNDDSTDNNCLEDAYCTGYTAECPESNYVSNDDNMPCIDNGTCIDGICVPFCETVGLKSCICQKVEDSCFRCCMNESDYCVRYIDPDDPDKGSVMLGEGSICVIGYCSQSGECESTVQDIVERFWDIIEDISFDLIGKIMSDNLVGTIIIFSVIIWMPCSCLVYYVDTKRLQEEEEVDNWMDPENVQLIRSEDEQLVRKHSGTLLPPDSPLNFDTFFAPD